MYSVFPPKGGIREAHPTAQPVLKFNVIDCHRLHFTINNRDLHCRSKRIKFVIDVIDFLLYVVIDVINDTKGAVLKI